MAYFSDAHLKIKWANHHIARLDARIELLKQSDVATIEIDPKFGNEIIKHDLADSSGRSDIALIAGDAFHNLKCALDYAWIEAITKLAPNAVGKFAKFPVYRTQDALEAALRGNGIEQSSSDLFRKMLDEIKPYATGNHAIWPIHRLDIRDKHRLLIPAILYSSVTGIETQDQAGNVSRNGFTAGTHQEPPWYIPMKPHVQVKNEGKISLTVSFEYGDGFDESIFADSLQMYTEPVVGVVKILEALV